MQGRGEVEDVYAHGSEDVDVNGNQIDMIKIDNLPHGRLSCSRLCLSSTLDVLVSAKGRSRRVIATATQCRSFAAQPPPPSSRLPLLPSSMVSFATPSENN